MKQFKLTRICALFMCLILLTGVVSGCTKGGETPGSVTSNSVSDSGSNKGTTTGKEAMGTSLATVARPRLLSGTAEDGTVSYTASVSDYSVADDFSNVLFTNLLTYQSEEMKQKLKANLFVVSGDAGMEFFQLYEFNRYGQVPSFVTVDSLVHTYHLYFMKLLKTTEKKYLFDLVSTLTDKLYEKSLKDYEVFKGTDWENAALTNVEFFAIAKILISGGNTPDGLPSEAASVVSSEYAKIKDASVIATCAVSSKNEDYTQYKVRGYYEGDETLEKYFKTMMWYGRITFPVDSEEMSRSALLISKSIAEVGVDEWSAVYGVTSFFAGNSDDNGVAEYIPCIAQAYEGNVTNDDLIKKTDAFTKYYEALQELPAPSVNSVPVKVSEDNSVKGFRLMGQRFTIDAYIMQNLIYRAVDVNEAGEARMLPDVLDVPAAFGSETAFGIAYEEGAGRFPDYKKNMETMRLITKNITSEFWNANIYSGWINALLPLLEIKREGYPAFMQTDEWDMKNLECFAGSYTELKHDTVLYAKPVMAEMGGGWEEEIDFRGYVEPQPEVYARMESLTKNMAAGLKKLNLLATEDETDLNTLAELCATLKNISVKELANETLTNEEYAFIETYGGNLEHLWYNAYKDDTTDYIDVGDHPASLVVDVATDPNGSVLELADGEPSVIYVVVPVDGTLRIARGVVYNFYQFTVGLDQRMTDDEWGRMIGTIPVDGEDGYPMYQKSPDVPSKPDWTMGYRAE